MWPSTRGGLSIRALHSTLAFNLPLPQNRASSGCGRERIRQSLRDVFGFGRRVSFTHPFTVGPCSAEFVFRVWGAVFSEVFIILRGAAGTVAGLKELLFSRGHGDG